MTKEKFTILSSIKSYKDKGELKRDTGAIKNTIMKNEKSLDIEQIAWLSVNGYALAFCLISKDSRDKSLSKDCWCGQRIIALDVDNACTHNGYLEYEEAIKKAEEASCMPAFIYSTSSHTDSLHRYRMVFVLDNIISDAQEYEKAYLSLCQIFKKNNLYPTDLSCRELSRIFYPGKQILYKNYGSRVSVSNLLSRYKEEKIVNKTAARKRPASDNAVTLQLEQFLTAFADYIKLSKKQNKIRSSTVDPSQTRMVDIAERVSSFGKKLIHIKYYEYASCQSSEAGTLTPIRDCGFLTSVIASGDLSNLFNLPLEQKFKCILHKDSNPSAMLQKKNGKFYYTCFGCNAHYDLIGLISAYTKESPSVVLRVFASILGLKIETEWQLQQKNMFRDYREYIATLLQIKYPYLYSQLKRKNLLSYLNFLIDYNSIYVIDKTLSAYDKPIFYSTNQQLAQSFNDMYGHNINAQTANRKNRYLAHLGLLHIVKDADIPEQMLKHLRYVQIIKGTRMRISCYTLPMMSEDMLLHAEQVLRQDIASNIRSKGFTKDALVLNNNIQGAQDIYVQSNIQTVSPEINRFFAAAVKSAESLLDKKGWFTEKEMLSKIRIHCNKEFMSAQCLPAILDFLKLERVRFTKKLATEYKINPKLKSTKLSYGASKIIIRCYKRSNEKGENLHS